MTDEQLLLDKLRRIEALFAGAATEGERAAADGARERIRARLRQHQAEDPPVEYRFSMRDAWSRRLFIALLRRYQLRPYRYPRQRHNTVMVRIPKTFVDKTLWPEFCQLNETLSNYLNEVTERVVGMAIATDTSEVEVRPEPVGWKGDVTAGGDSLDPE